MTSSAVLAVAADEEGRDQHHERDQDDDLDQRERAPRSRRALVVDRPARLGAAAGRGFAAASARGRAAGRRAAGAAAACGACVPLSSLPGVTGIAGGRGPPAKGQPEESRTRHQPSSMPRIPQRGRECQCRQPGSPMSSLETITQRWRSAGRRSSARAGRGWPPRRRPGGPSSAWASRSRSASASRMRSSSPIESTRGPPTAPTPHSSPRRGKAEANSSPSSRSSRAIWRRRSVAREALGGGRDEPPPASARLPASGPSRVLEQFGQGPRSSPWRILTAAGPRRRARAPPRPRSPGTPADLDRDQQRALGLRGRRPAPRPSAPNSSASGRCGVGDHQRPGGQLARAALERLAGRRSAGSRAAPRPGRRRRRAAPTPDSMIAIVSASSSRLRLLKPPCFIRSSASSSTGVRCSSGSRPMWRKKTR